MLFVDASVIVAILAQEDDAEVLMDRLGRDTGPFYISAVSRLEATLSLTRRLAEASGRDKPATPEMIKAARQMVDQFTMDIDARDVLISSSVGDKAIDAAQQYGKIVNHRANLNMGDCLAYACAKAYRAQIAYKGDDFTYTDMGW